MKPMMNDDGLLECPFCGGENSMKDEDGQWHFVVCQDCGCRTDDWVVAATAIIKWNTRGGFVYSNSDYEDINDEVRS